MNATQDVQQFGQLRARLEATFSDPTMIVVTSASRGDGKSVTAFGLAAALAESDHRVLLVDANVNAPTLPRAQHRPVPVTRLEIARVSSYASPVAGQQFSGLSFADERLEAGVSMETVKAAARDMKCHFDFTIVDMGTLIHSNLAVLFSTIAEGTMLTLRLGRLPTTADDETIKTLTRAGATILGALTVTPKMIKEFRERLVTVERNTMLPVRHVTSKHTIEPAREIIEPAPRSTFVR